MRKSANGDNPTVVTLVNGEIRRETHISFSSASIINGEIRVQSVEGNQIQVQMPGMDVALRFDLDGVQQVPNVEPEPIEDKQTPAGKSLSVFNWKTLLITFFLWVFVGLFSGALGFFVAAGYFGYQWRQVAKRKKLLSNGQSLPPASTQAQDRAQTNPSKLSRQSVRDALARHR
ncbi:DUF3329 domain-containing protein [Pseudomonas kribbensis]|uniref:DUF3329 domain-containing protein n=1 Tax=Pseudomonas kribbensis TaxID=1628086 RepID=A0A4Y8VH94_9PSED|nr:DUF3329 domain-containing protein [Pseudomonas kribbensis]TFH79449.1 DUF3329 domain-containing protein [Pseudomonas kribbensis]